MCTAVPNLVELLVFIKPTALWTCMACRVRASASWYSLESKWLCGYPSCKYLLHQDGQGSADASSTIVNVSKAATLRGTTP